MHRRVSNNPLYPEYVLDMQDLLDRGLASNAESSGTIDTVHRDWRSVSDSAFKPEMIRLGLEVQDLDLREQLQLLNRLLGGKLEQWRSDRDMSNMTEGGRVSGDHELEEHHDGGRMAKAVRFVDLMEAMLTLEPEIRAFYPDWHSYGSKMYADVFKLTVDGCFLVELFRLYYDLRHTESIGLAADEAVPAFTNPQILTNLRRDLLLSNNQLPFFVLEKLFELINKKNNVDPRQAVPLEVLVVIFFDRPLPKHDAASKLNKAHLLKLIHSTFLQSVSKKVHNKGQYGVKSRYDPSGRFGVLHFVSELEEAGVQFKNRKGHDLLDIDFSHRTLRVPSLSINEHTISLLLNFAAYEADSGIEPIFTNYLMFWNSLINSPGDIQLLHKHGIINTTFRSDIELADLFRRIRDITYDHDLRYFYNEIKELNEYCEQYYENKYHLWWRSLIRERFSSPWTCLSLFAAIILLLLTVRHTFYAVYSCYRPR